MHSLHAAFVGVLALLGSCLAGPGFTTCPKETPCYDMRMEKCKAGDATTPNGAGLVYCDASLTGFCDDKKACYDFGSGCVCEGARPCHKFNGICQVWTEECTPKNVFLQWCPSSPPPVPMAPGLANPSGPAKDPSQTASDAGTSDTLVIVLVIGGVVVVVAAIAAFVVLRLRRSKSPSYLAYSS